MIKKTILGLALVFLFCWGCSSNDTASSLQERQQWLIPNGKIKVLSTIAMIDDLVKQIGGDYVDCSTLIDSELDPHSYQLVKGDDERLALADLIFYNGLGLEHGPSLQRFLSQNAKSISLGNKLMGDYPHDLLRDQGQLDPHIWMDISLWAKTIPYIVETLAQKDPEHAETYRSNGEKLIANLLQTHQEIRQELQHIASSQRYLVTSHDAFNYFAKAYLADEGDNEQEWRARIAAPEGLAPESQISVTDIQAIIDYLQYYHVRVLFPESNVSKDSIRKIVQAAKEKHLDVTIADVPLYADAMGKPGSSGDSYLNMIRHNARTIALYLKNNGIE